MRGLNKIKNLTDFNDFYQEDVAKILKRHDEIIEKVDSENPDSIKVYLSSPRNSDDSLVRNKAIVDMVQNFNADDAHYLLRENAIRFWWD